MASEVQKAEAIVALADLHRQTKRAARIARDIGVPESTLMEVLQRDCGQLQRLLHREN